MGEVDPTTREQPMPIRTEASQPIEPVMRRMLAAMDAEAVADDVSARLAVGERRYGAKLSTFNGRDVLRDLYEELLDGIAYATQPTMEGTPPQGATVRARRYFALHKLVQAAVAVRGEMHERAEAR